MPQGKELGVLFVCRSKNEQCEMLKKTIAPLLVQRTQGIFKRVEIMSDLRVCLLEVEDERVEVKCLSS